MFDAKEIDFATIEADPDDGLDDGTGLGRGFAVAGAGTIQPVKQSAASVEQFKQRAADQSCTASPYLNRLEDVEEGRKA